MAKKYIEPQLTVYEDNLVKDLMVWRKRECEPKQVRANRAFAKQAAKTLRLGTLQTYRVWVYHPNERPPSWVRAVEQPTLDECLKYGGIYFAKTHAWIMWGWDNPRIAKTLDTKERRRMRLHTSNDPDSFSNAFLIHDGEAVYSPDNPSPFKDHGFAWPHVCKLTSDYHSFNIQPEVAICSNEEAQDAIDNMLDVKSYKATLADTVRDMGKTQNTCIAMRRRLEQVFNECVLPRLTPVEDRMKRLYEIMDGFMGQHIEWVNPDKPKTRRSGK